MSDDTFWPNFCLLSGDGAIGAFCLVSSDDARGSLLLDQSGQHQYGEKLDHIILW